MTTPTDKPKNRELSPREWEALRIQWITAGRPHVWRFLTENGHPNRTGGLRKRVSKWLLLDEVKQLAEPVDNVVHLPKTVKIGGVEKASEQKDGPHVPEVMAPAGPLKKEADAWSLVLEWREKQALEDYRSADRIRMNIKLMLQESVYEAPSPKGDGTVIYKSRLKPAEAKQLAQSLEAIQRVQRLALGLSTDNIGVNVGGGGASGGKGDATGSEVDKPKDEGIPTFVVEMNRNGKFTRARPRRAQ